MEILGLILPQLWYGGCIYLLLALCVGAYIGMSEPRTPQWLTKLVDSMVAWQHIAIAYGLGWLYMIFYY